MTLEATAETWGISGPTFLLVYLVLAVAVWIAGTQTRRMLADPRATGPAADVTAHPHDVAYLNGGADLAVYSALSSMHLRGTITSSRGAVQSAGRLDPGTDGLERAIHFTARGRCAAAGCRSTAPCAPPCPRSRSGWSAPACCCRRSSGCRIRRVGLWMLAVAVLGLVRLLAGVAEAKPVGFLVAALDRRRARGRRAVRTGPATHAPR